MSYYPDWCTGRTKLLCVDKIDAYAKGYGEDELDDNEELEYDGYDEAGMRAEELDAEDAGFLQRLVLGIIKDCPMAALDRCMLYGLVYESMLGHFRAGQYTLSFCMEHPRELSLPATREIDTACRWAVKRCLAL